MFIIFLLQSFAVLHLVWYRELPKELLTEVLKEVKLRLRWNADTITVRNLKS